MADADNAIPIAACVFNAFLSYTTIMLNIITIHALRQTSVLQKNLKTWLLSLSVADLGVGLLAQPFYITLLVMKMEQNDETIYKNTRAASLIVTNIIFLFSFLLVAALAFDRFLAIYLHLRYQELVTRKRVVTVVISIWVLSASFSLLELRITEERAMTMIVVILIVCLVATALSYFKIYLVVRRHTQQISALQTDQVARNDEQVVNAERQKKSAVAVFYVYLVLLVCYLPNISIIGVLLTRQHEIPPNIWFFTDALVFLNSFLNPLIYCWKLRPIRQAIINILQKICLKHIHAVETPLTRIC